MGTDSRNNSNSRAASSTQDGLCCKQGGAWSGQQLAAGTQAADVPDMRRCCGSCPCMSRRRRRSQMRCRRAVCAAKLPDSGIGAASSSLLALKQEHLRPADTRHLHAPRAPLQGGADDATGLLIAALAGPRYHTPIGRGNEDLGAASTCHAVAARAAAGERMQRPCRPEST